MAQVTSVKIKVNNIDKVLEEMKDQVNIALAAIGETAEGYAKDNCPVDTGRLRNSITNKVEPDAKAVHIGTNVEYAPYVEFRDVNHKTGRAHFLRDAVTDHTDHYKSILEAALKK